MNVECFHVHPVRKEKSALDNHSNKEVISNAVARDNQARFGDGTNALVRGSSAKLFSSRDLNWNGVSLECHDTSPGERPASVATHDLITLFTNASQGECDHGRGRPYSYAYTQGKTQLFGKGPLSAWRPFSQTSMIICVLDPGFVDEVGEELDFVRPEAFSLKDNGRDPNLGQLIGLLGAEARNDGMSGLLYADHLVHALVLRLFALSAATPDTGEARKQTLPPIPLRRVLERMQADASGRVGLETLAAESGYSRSRFLSMFKASMGCSPHQWLIRVRIEHVKEMLRSDSAPLINIAAICGFSSHGHLSRTFRQVVGVPPNQYRRCLGAF